MPRKRSVNILAGRVYKDRTGEVFGTFKITGAGFSPEGSRRVFYPCTCEKCHVSVDVPFGALKDGTAVCETCEENKRKIKDMISTKKPRKSRSKKTETEAVAEPVAEVVKEETPVVDTVAAAEPAVEEVTLNTIGLGDLNSDVIMDQYENKDTDLITAIMGTPERPEGEDDHIYALRRIYRCIVSRCYNELDSKYDQYGAKGIEIEPIWFNKAVPMDEDKFQNFARWAIVKGWAEGKTLIRLDTSKNYGPKNCKLVRISDLVKK